MGILNTDFERIMGMRKLSDYPEAEREFTICKECGKSKPRLVIKNWCGFGFDVSPNLQLHDECIDAKDPKARSKTNDASERQRRQANIEDGMRRMKVPDDYSHCTFDTFQILSQTHKKLLKQVQSALSAGKSIIFYSKPKAKQSGCGIGKTHLAVACMNDCRVNLCNVSESSLLFVSVGVWASRLVSGGYSISYLWDNAIKAKIMVFDDVGYEPNRSIEPVQDLLRTRIENNKRTFITTNLSPTEMTQRYGAAVWSRLAAKCEVIPMSGADFRMKGK